MRAQQMPKRRSSRASGADEVYSFASRDVYPSSAVVITIARTADKFTITTERPRAIPAEHSTRHLSAAAWMEFQSALERAGFWTMPERDDRIGLDGFTWAIRGRCGEREHSSTCRSPSEGPFFELGSLFVKLAGVALTYEPP
jgi:hypothetical protein